MKKLFLLLPLLLLAGCTMPGISSNRGDEKVDYFEKDALCQNYIENIKNDVTIYDNEISYHNGFSAFYSPVLKQCVVSYSEYYNSHQEGYEEFSVYSYQTADRNSICSFKYGTKESRVLCTNNMYYDKQATKGGLYVDIAGGPKDENILNHLDQEEKYLKGLK